MSYQSLSVSALLAEVGVRARALRLARNLSQEQLAVQSSVSRSTIKRLESGNGSVSLANLISVMQVLGLVDELIEVMPSVENEAQVRQRASGRRLHRDGNEPPEW